MLGLEKYEQGVCECGWHESLAGDKANHFTFDNKTCPVCAGIEKYQRIQRADDEAFEKKLGEKPNPRTQRPADGRRTFTRLMTADEVAARNSKRARGVT